MKAFLPLTTLAVFTALSISGQVITDIVPESGDVAQIDINFQISEPGESGADAVWNFESVGFDSPTVYLVVNAADAPGNENFPEATHAIVIDMGDEVFIYNFHDYSEGEWADHGSHFVNNLEEATTTTINTGPRIPFDVPLTTGSSGAMSYQSSYQFGDSELNTDWNYSWEVDARGTLILPNATYEDVLRVRGVDVSTGIFSETVTEYIWVKDGVPFPLLSLSISETDFGGGPEISTHAGALISYSETGLNELAGGFHAAVFPNPVGDILNFKVSEHFGPIVSISVIDALGRVVLNREIGGGHPAESVTIGVEYLTPGIYLLRVEGDGAATESRFFKR